MIFLYKLGNATQYTCIKLKYMRLQTYLRVFAVYQVNKDGTAVAESILFPVRIFLISKGWRDSCGICYLKYVYQNFKRSFQYQIGMNIKFKLLFLTFIQVFEDHKELEHIALEHICTAVELPCSCIDTLASLILLLKHL